jgi:hypothetical protein
MGSERFTVIDDGRPVEVTALLTRVSGPRRKGTSR